MTLRVSIRESLLQKGIQNASTQYLFFLHANARRLTLCLVTSEMH
jgi:hypothetical protein